MLGKNRQPPLSRMKEGQCRSLGAEMGLSKRRRKGGSNGNKWLFLARSQMPGG